MYHCKDKLMYMSHVGCCITEKLMEELGPLCMKLCHEQKQSSRLHHSCSAEHPTYTPDWAPSDFFLFPNMRSRFPDWLQAQMETSMGHQKRKKGLRGQPLRPINASERATWAAMVSDKRWRPYSHISRTAHMVPATIF